MTPILAFIFDFDGVLTDTEKIHWQSMQDVLAPYDAQFSWETYCRDYIGFDDRDALRAALAAAGDIPGPAELHDLVARKAAAFMARAESAKVPPFPGAVEAVRAAAAQGPIALCTGAIPSDINPLLSSFGLDDLFKVRITAEDVARSKPDPESYRLAAKSLHTPPESCLAIEDTPQGLQSARAAGCQTLGVAQTHPPEDLLPFADQVILNMTEFPHALG